MNNNNLEEGCRILCSKMLRKIGRIWNLNELNIELDDSLELNHLLAYIKRSLEYVWMKNWNKTKNNNGFRVRDKLSFNIRDLMSKLSECSKVIRKSELFLSSYASCLVLLHFLGEEEYILHYILPLFNTSLICRDAVFRVICFVFRTITAKRTVKFYAKKAVRMLVLSINSIPAKIPEMKPRITHKLEEIEISTKDKLNECKQAAVIFVRMISHNCSKKDIGIITFLEEMLNILASMLNSAHVTVVLFILITMLDVYTRKMLDNDEDISPPMKCFFLDNIRQLAVNVKCISDRTRESLDNKMNSAFEEYKSLNLRKMSKTEFLECAAYHFSLQEKNPTVNTSGFVLMFFYFRFCLEHKDVSRDEFVLFISKLMKNQNALRNVSSSIKGNREALQYLVLCNPNDGQLITKSWKCILSVICSEAVINVRVKAIKGFFNLIQNCQLDLLGIDEELNICKSILSDKYAVVREAMLNEITDSNFQEFYTCLYKEIVLLTKDQMKSVRKQAYVSLQRYYNMTNNESIRTDILLVMFECLNDNELDIQNLVNDYICANLFTESWDAANLCNTGCYNLAINHFPSFRLWYSLLLNSVHLSNHDSPVFRTLNKLMVTLLDELQVNQFYSIHLEIICMTSVKQPILLTSGITKLITFATNWVTEMTETNGEKIFKMIFKTLENFAKEALGDRTEFQTLEQRILENLPTIICSKLDILLSYLAATMCSETKYSVIVQHYTTCWVYLVNATEQIRTKNEISDTERRKIFCNIYFLSQLISKFDFSNETQFPNFMHSNPKLYEHFENMLFHWMADAGFYQKILLSSTGLYYARNSNRLGNRRTVKLYTSILTDEHEHIAVKVQVILILTEILHKDNVDPQEVTSLPDRPNKRLKRTVNDETPGTKIVRHYLKLVLDCYICNEFTLRHAVCGFVMTVYAQGFINPTQVLPHIIAMTTDVPEISTSSKTVLKTIVENYPTMIRSAIKDGLLVTFHTHYAIQNGCSNPLVRGYFETPVDNQQLVSLNSYLFSLLTQNNFRKAFLDAIIASFASASLTIQSIQMQLFIAESCAYLDYTMDDVLYLLKAITNLIIISKQDVDEQFGKINEVNPLVLHSHECIFESYRYKKIIYELLELLKGYLMTVYSISDKVLFHHINNSIKTSNKRSDIRRKIIKFNLNEFIGLISNEIAFHRNAADWYVFICIILYKIVICLNL